jgi:hypothetical protein
MMNILKIGIGTGIAVGAAGFAYALAIRPWQSSYPTFGQKHGTKEMENGCMFARQRSAIL